MDTPHESIARLPQVRALTGLSRSTLYARVAQRLLTSPISLGGRAVGWPLSEVAAINSARISGRTDDEIRALVAELEAARKSKAVA